MSRPTPHDQHSSRFASASGSKDKDVDSLMSHHLDPAYDSVVFDSPHGQSLEWYPFDNYTHSWPEMRVPSHSGDDVNVHTLDPRMSDGYAHPPWPPQQDASSSASAVPHAHNDRHAHPTHPSNPGLSAPALTTPGQPSRDISQTLQNLSLSHRTVPLASSQAQQIHTSLAQVFPSSSSYMGTGEGGGGGIDSIAQPSRIERYSPYRLPNTSTSTASRSQVPPAPAPAPPPQQPQPHRLPAPTLRPIAPASVPPSPASPTTASIRTSGKGRPRNTQSSVPPNQLDSVLRDDSCQCPVCGYTPSGRRAPDLRRHMETHQAEVNHNKWVCCGVPVSMAASFGITDIRGSYIFKGTSMIGGCLQGFSRKDALQRHINRSNMVCCGDVDLIQALIEQ